jgi:hypothetical protein
LSHPGIARDEEAGIWRVVTRASNRIVCWRTSHGSCSHCGVGVSAPGAAGSTLPCRTSRAALRARGIRAAAPIRNARPSTRGSPAPDKSRRRDQTRGARDRELLATRYYGCSIDDLYNGERPHQSLDDQTPQTVYRTGIGGGAMIVDKFGGAGGGTPVPLRSTGVPPPAETRSTATAPTEAKAQPGQRRPAATEVKCPP